MTITLETYIYDCPRDAPRQTATSAPMEEAAAKRLHHAKPKPPGPDARTQFIHSPREKKHTSRSQGAHTQPDRNQNPRPMWAMRPFKREADLGLTAPCRGVRAAAPTPKHVCLSTVTRLRIARASYITAALAICCV